MTPPARRDRRAALVWGLGLTGLAMLVTLSAGLGAYPVAPADVVRVVGAHLWGGAAPVDGRVDTVVWNIRLPRIAAAIVIGAALAAAGTAYQALFRNPLVSPDVLGVSAGASLGAVLGIFLSLPVAMIQTLSFAGGLGAVAAVYGIGRLGGGRDPVLVLVLAGVAIGALLGAAVSLVKILADPYDKLPTITFWLLGSLASVTRADVLSILPATLLGLAPLALLRWRINVLTLGDDQARALGVATGPVRGAVIAGATLASAAAVSISGVIGWIGLVIPHVARLIVGPDISRLLPASVLMGSAYLVLIDLAARTLARTEVPLGILSAVVGAPFFLALLLRGRSPS